MSYLVVQLHSVAICCWFVQFLIDVFLLSPVSTKTVKLAMDNECYEELPEVESVAYSAQCLFVQLSSE